MRASANVSRLLQFTTLVLIAACAEIFGSHQDLKIIGGDNQVDTVNSALKYPLTIQLQQSNGQVRFSSATVLLSPTWDPGYLTNGIDVTTDADGNAAVFIRFTESAGAGEVTIVDYATNHVVEAHFTVLPGAPRYVRAEPPDSALYVGGSETLRPFITDSYGNRRSDHPSYQIQALDPAIAVAGSLKVSGASIGRGSVSVSAMGFADTVSVSVVPNGRIAIQEAYIVATNLDGSAFDTIPTPWGGRHSLDWSPVTRKFLYDVDASDYRNLILQDTAGHAQVVVIDRLMHSEYWPRYAHDGASIYFAGIDSLSNCWGVWRVHTDGTALQQIVADTLDCGPYAYATRPLPDYAPCPSPDDARLVYLGDRNIPYLGGVLHVRTIATGADTSLGVRGAFPRWSPTGEWIAYDSTGTLMLIHPDGTGNHALLYRGDYSNPIASWSPDGQWLVYSGSPYLGCPDKSACFTGLKIVQVATGLTLSLPYTAYLTDPTWLR